MNILILNGSPKAGQSNTYCLTKAFLHGITEAGGADIREHTVCKMQIKPCLGCFSCWNKTPGHCCIQDDMPGVIGDMLWADIVIWSFPLYYFSVPGSLKNLIDRQLPMALPFMTQDSENGGHPARYDMTGKRHVVISTCGFYTACGNYGGVNAIFDHMCGRGNYTAIYCGQGELFRVPELHQCTDEYLGWVRDAGREFASGSISRETEEKLQQLLYPREVFEAMADASWGVEKTGVQMDESLTFTRQMAALYNIAAYPGKDIVLEMSYIDLRKRYQILLTKEGSRVLAEDFLPATTTIETPYSLWKAIAAGQISGQDAMMQQKYRVTGDFDLMIHWDRYFGSPSSAAADGQSSASKSANMNILLIPWITLWVAGAIHAGIGAVISLLVCALVPLLFFRNKKTVYDAVSTAAVTALSVALLYCPQRIVIPAAYGCFGLMWTASAFLAIPLTAHYSMKDYNGKEALNNPLFIKTNRILTLCWGILYLLTPVWTYWIMGTAAASWTGAVNSILPLLMGVFTGWFRKWYPAKVAAGKIQ